MAHSKKFLPTTFGNDPACISFADICNKCESKFEYSKYVSRINKFTEMMKSIKNNKFKIEIAEILLQKFIIDNHTEPIITHYNNIIKAKFRRIILNKNFSNIILNKT